MLCSTFDETDEFFIGKIPIYLPLSPYCFFSAQYQLIRFLLLGRGIKLENPPVSSYLIFQTKVLPNSRSNSFILE
jgi:hypothetical protein